MYFFAPAKIELDAISKYQLLLSNCFPKSNRFSQEYLLWLYRDNPWGPIIGFDAFLGEDLVAHYVVMPVVARWDNEVIEGVLSLNTATDPKHQGKGLFTQLANLSYKRAEAMGKKFVIGVANANSTPGFVKKLGFNLLSPLDAFVFVGKPRRNSELPSFCLNWEVHSRQWRLNSPSLKTFSDSSAYQYVSEKAGIIKMLVNSRPWEMGLARGLPTPINAYIGLNNCLDWSKTVRIHVPKKFRPSPLNFIYKPLGTFSKVIDTNSMAFESIDFDAY